MRLFGLHRIRATQADFKASLSVEVYDFEQGLRLVAGACKQL